MKWWIGTVVLVVVFGAFYVADVMAGRTPAGPFTGTGARRA